MCPTLTSTVFIAQVWEPPDVGEVHGEADDGQEEVDLLAPGLALLSGGVRLTAGTDHGRGGDLHPILLLHQGQLHLFGAGGAGGLDRGDGWGHVYDRESASRQRTRESGSDAEASLMGRGEQRWMWGGERRREEQISHVDQTSRPDGAC